MFGEDEGEGGGLIPTGLGKHVTHNQKSVNGDDKKANFLKTPFPPSFNNKVLYVFHRINQKRKVAVS